MWNKFLRAMSKKGGKATASDGQTQSADVAVVVVVGDMAAEEAVEKAHVAARETRRKGLPLQTAAPALLWAVWCCWLLCLWLCWQLCLGWC